MRRKTNINEGWAFSKECKEVPVKAPQDWEMVDLPHTWNALDGQDGGSDYYRGACYYVKKIQKPEGERVYLEFEAAANAATVYINGEQVAYHEGGYSTFRTDITDKLQEETIIAVCVDNSPKSNIYPQTADFTFYGGLYRDVNIISVPKSHFDLEYFGSQGLEVTSEIKGMDAVLNLNTYIQNAEAGQTVEFQICDADGRIKANASCPADKAVEFKLMLPNVHLWQGVEDPYLYTVKAMLVVHNEVIDEVSARIGVRSFHVDPQKGFFLNGKFTPLRGVSRHQDLLGVGNALTKEQHYADMELIKEVGANTIRLAHYQHSQYFYDACDEAGMIVWAEIPFISVMNADPKAHENCISQMKELIIQNYNHPSICFWGISNEITIGGERAGLAENLKDLNELVHKMDPTRLSTMAQVSMLPKESGLNQISDLVSYNHYFGWYGGELQQNEKWLDEFHSMYPSIPLGISEYGAEGIISYHNDDPKVKDYSEEYQALYHEHMAKIISERPWLWATHIWNMFDFGCDARDEGGVKGRNNKGLVTLDRKIRKDSFYLYKAYWSNEKFVHICSHRYVQRIGDTTTIKVYSNEPCVEIWINGEFLEAQEGSHVFCFEQVPLKDTYTLVVAKAGKNTDSMTIQKVTESNPDYIVPMEDDSEGVANWFNLDDYKDATTIEIKEGYFSIKDKVGDILKNEDAGNALIQVIGQSVGMKLKKSMLNMMAEVPLEEMTALSGNMAGNKDTDANEMLLLLNNILNKIPK